MRLFSPLRSRALGRASANTTTLLLVSGLTACGAGSSLDEYEDGVPSVVPSPIKSLPDGGGSVDPDASGGGAVGDSCGVVEDCQGSEAQCLISENLVVVTVEFDGGYCAQSCQDTSECPAGSACIATFGTCLKSCDDSTDCRVADGYTCAPPPLGGGDPFCLPEGVVNLIGGGAGGGFLAGLGGGGDAGGGGFLAGLGGGDAGGGGTGGFLAGLGGAGGETGGFLAGLLGGGGGGTPGGSGDTVLE